tara:strand:- start:299 stop:1003 length:705 start_codon:yes stop_codon:yes gene_type:complete
METANTDSNVAETPFPQNSNPRTGPKTIESVARELVAAIIAKVQADIEPVDQSIHELVEEVVESQDFEHRVSELAYGQAEDYFCDADISDKVDECLEYRDWADTVGSLVEGYVDNACEDLQAEFASKEYVISMEVCLEERIEEVERLTGGDGYDGKLGSDIRLLGQISVDLMTHETRVCDLEAFEARTMERLDLLEERLTELEQFTSSKFGQLDNIQIAFRGIVETMFARTNAR